MCILSNQVKRAFGLQKERGDSQGCLIYLTLAHHVCILQFWMQVLVMEWIVSKDSVLYCQITPTLPTFCLHTSASAILDGQLWSHWLQDCHFYLLCHAQSPIVSSFFSLNWKFCRLSPFMTERLGFADVFCNLLACLSNNNLRYKAKLFDLYKRMGLWGKKTFKYTTTLVFWLRMAFFVFPVSSCLVLDDLWGALFKVSYITGGLMFLRHFEYWLWWCTCSCCWGTSHTAEH